ncbi:hypothetical protein [Pragia fontium]|uniref:hypothetical protein n=1 Tax=Pragia fontium TaxID=82985 RepID=UPI0010AA04BE|nr:hypothetical protein [Pragia fontium]
MLGLQKSPRFLISRGENANGWYEIYSDGFKRIGQIYGDNNPLIASNPGYGANVSYPIPLTSRILSITTSINGRLTGGAEVLNYAEPQLSSITLAAASSHATKLEPLSPIKGSWVVEGY